MPEIVTREYALDGIEHAFRDPDWARAEASGDGWTLAAACAENLHRSGDRALTAGCHIWLGCRVGEV